MAVPPDRFSIREYTVKVRAVDVAKSWPFGGRPDIESLSAPITVKKFRWWSDELAQAEEEDDDEAKDCSGSTEVEEEMEVVLDICSKTKQCKAPKERSIVDIFAVAPHVERLDVDADYEDDGDGEGDSGEESGGGKSRVLALSDVRIKEKSMTKELNSKGESVGNLKKARIGSKSKMKDSVSRLAFSAKEKPQKLKSALLVNFTRTSNSSLHKGSEGTSNAVPNLKRKSLKAKCLSAQNNHRSMQAPKLIKHGKSDLTAGNNLKNCTKVVSEVGSIVGNPQLGMLRDDMPDGLSERDNATGPGRKAYPSAEHNKIQNFVIPQPAKENAVEMGKNLATTAINIRGEDVQCEREVQPAREKKKSDPYYSDTLSLQRLNMEFQRFLSERLMAENQVAQHNEEADDPNSNNTEILSATTVSSLEYMEAFPRPSSSTVATYGDVQNRVQVSSQNSEVNYSNHYLHQQPLPHLSPGGVMRSLFSFPDLKQKAVMTRVNYMDQDFCGLPLNSQGELIHLNYSGRGIFNQLMRPENVATESSRRLPMHNLQTNSTSDLLSFKDKNYFGGSKACELLKAHPIRNLMGENSKFPALTELRGSGGKEGDFLGSSKESSSVYNLQSTLERMSQSHHEQGQFNQVQNQMEDEISDKQRSFNQIPLHVSQPTMRLMGQEFTVSRNSKDSQLSEDEKVWTDKKIISEHHAASRAIDTSLVQSSFLQELSLHPVSGNSEDNRPFLATKSHNQESQSVMHLDIGGSRLPYPFLTSQADTRYTHLHSSMSSNHSLKLHPYLPSIPSPPLPTQSFPLQEPFIYGYGSLSIDSSANRVDSVSHINMGLNQHRLPYPTRSGIEFPFLPSDPGHNLNSSTSLPQWFISAKQQKEIPLPSYISYLNGGDRLPSSTFSGTSFQAIPSLQHPTEISYQHDPGSSFLRMPGSLGTTSFAQPQMAPLNNRPMSTSLMNNIHGYRAIPSFSTKDLKKRKTTRKRGLNKLDGSSRPTKIPNLKVQDISGNKEVMPGVSSLEFNFIREKLNNMEQLQTETRKDELLDRGPVNLSAGKNCTFGHDPSLNQDNLRPGHSMVPSAAATSRRDHESGNALTPIFRL